MGKPTGEPQKDGQGYLSPQSSVWWWGPRAAEAPSVLHLMYQQSSLVFPQSSTTIMSSECQDTKYLVSTGLKYNKDIYSPSTLPSSTFCFCLLYLLPHAYRVAATAHTSCPHSGSLGRNSPVVTQQQPPNAHSQKGGPQDHLCCKEAYLPRDYWSPPTT